MLLIDDEIFLRQKYGGVSRIFVELLKSLAPQKEVSYSFQSTYTENAYLKALLPHSTRSFLENFSFPLKGKLIRAFAGGISHQKTNSSLGSGSIDIFHPTFYSDYFFEALPSKTKLVFTLHDLTHEKESHPLAEIKKRNLARANHIICVSEATRREMHSLYPFTKEKACTVIPLAQSLPKEAITVKDLPATYLLFVGERHGYKNFDTLLRAFALLQYTHPELHLICTGNRPWTKRETEDMQKLGVNQKVKLLSVTDEQLKFLYQQAACFIYPSLNEGFGIPTLEAMHCGCPVILSDIPVFKEVAGEAAIFFQATDVPMLSEAIDGLLSHAELKKQMIAMGKEREQAFTWQNHVNQTLSIYKQLL